MTPFYTTPCYYYTPLNFELDKTILHHTADIIALLLLYTIHTIPYMMHSIAPHYTTLHVPQRCQLSWILHESHEIDIYLMISWALRYRKQYFSAAARHCYSHTTPYVYCSTHMILSCFAPAYTSIKIFFGEKLTQSVL